MDKILFRMKTPGSASKKMRFVSFSGALFPEFDTFIDFDPLKAL